MKLHETIFKTPWYDTHCHMACNEAVGLSNGKAGAFACDCARGFPLPPLDLWALLTAPYMKWMLLTIGENVDARARSQGYPSALEWARTAPGLWWAAHWKLYARLKTTGVSRALARGIRELHRVELRFEEKAPVEAIDEKIRAVYEAKGFYGWWAEAFGRLQCVRAVKLVEMPYYDAPPASEEDWEKERALAATALRVDSFTALNLPPERMGFRMPPKTFGIEARGLEDYLAQVGQTLERAQAGGMRALKNAVAYSGSLKLPPPDDAAAGRYVREGNPEDYRPFEAAVLRRLLEWANARELPYQMHAGVATLPWCNCELLAEQIAAYPGVRFTLLHLYPYLREAGCLARLNANVYLDPCWLSILAPETLRAALREWIGLVPPEKMLYGVDATSVEEWFGGAIAAKEILAEVLEEKVRAGALNESEAITSARQMLHDTAHGWYGRAIART